MSFAMVSHYALRRWMAYGLLAATVLVGVVRCTAEVDGTGPGTPAISLALSPTAASVEQGGSATVTATLTASGGFTGSVSLAVEGVPAGVTGTVSDVQTTDGVTTATVTIQVGASVAPGTYNITVRGSGAGVSDATASFALTVTAAPTYTLALTPNALTIEQGTTGQASVTITRTNFTGAVTLSLGSAPAGVTGAFDPAAPTGTTSTLTVTVGAAVAPGVYNLTVDGTGSAGDRDTPLTLTVTATPDYSLALNPTSLSIEQGTTGQSAVTITRSNFTGAVTLSLGNAPAGVTGAFVPAAPTGTTSTLTVTVGGLVAPGVYNLTVDGTGSAGARSTALTLTVTAAAESYTMTLTPTALSIEQGGSNTTEVTFARANFTGGVDLTVENAPAGVTGSFDPTPATGDASTLTISVGAAVALGQYTLTVRGAASGLTDRTATLTLTVTGPPDYTLALNPAALSVEQGTTGQSTVTISRTNFTGAVTLSLGNAPAGVTGAFDPAAPTGTTSTLTVTVGAAVTPGVYNLTVNGTGSAGDRDTPLTLTVTATPDYSLALNPTSLSIEQGTTGQSTVTLTRTNFTGAVTLSLGNAPAGVTGAFSPAAPTGTTSTLTVTVGAAVAPGVYNLTVDGTGSAGDRSTALTLTVTAAGYTLSMTPTSVSVAQGGSTSATININRTAGFSATVTLTVTGAPVGLTATPAPSSTTGNSSSLDVTASAALAAGSYTLTIRGNASGLPEETTTLGVTVTASGGGNVTVDFSACELADRPVWVAFQDGTGAWNQASGSNDSYTFSITQAKGGVAYVTLDGGNPLVFVQYLAQGEMTGTSLQFCSTSSTKTVNGTAAGLALGEGGFISLGGGLGTAFANGPFQITGVKDGSFDLVAYKSVFGDPGTGARMLLRRDQNIVNGGTVGTIDFAGTEAFDPASGTMTVNGTVGGETIIANMSYFTATPADACQQASLYAGLTPAGTNFTAYGAPGAQQNADDFHQIFVNVVGTNESRSAAEYFQTMGARTVTLGATLPTPTITTLGGPYKRLQSSLTMPSDYASGASFSYVASATSKSVFIFASAGWLGGLAVTLGLDDFSGVSGWDNNWAPALADAVQYNLTGMGATGSACTEGARTVSANRSGTN